MISMQSDRLFTNELFVEGPTPARFWGDQWLRVSEKLLKGLNNELATRVANLELAVGKLEGENAAADRAFVKGLGKEVIKLNDLLQLYRALNAETLESPEPVRLQDLVPQAVSLHEHHVDLHHIPCQVTGHAGTEPVRVRHMALVRCAIVLLASVGGHALRSKRLDPITLEFGTENAETWLRMRGAAPGGQLLFSGQGSLLHAVRAALAHAHASAEGVIHRSHEGDTIEYELRFPAGTA
jgi:hypothetical protein